MRFNIGFCWHLAGKNKWRKFVLKCERHYDCGRGVVECMQFCCPVTASSFTVTEYHTSIRFASIERERESKNIEQCFDASVVWNATKYRCITYLFIFGYVQHLVKETICIVLSLSPSLFLSSFLSLHCYMHSNSRTRLHTSVQIIDFI